MSAPRRRKIGQSWGLGPFLFLVLFTFGLASLGIWQVRRQYQVVAMGYEIDRDLFEYRRLLERQKRLTLLLSAYKDPTALQTFAEEDLGMRTPARDDELHIPDGPDPKDALRPGNGLLPTSTLVPLVPPAAPSDGGSHE
ncbi:MAG: cell division protein FtsL [Deltaproteobacteria bacterium]|jgi:hypothetical protein|nr:cell division protein FtsL [Deltaproteobacteria bacterium]